MYTIIHVLWLLVSHYMYVLYTYSCICMPKLLEDHKTVDCLNYDSAHISVNYKVLVSIVSVNDVHEKFTY